MIAYLSHPVDLLAGRNEEFDRTVREVVDLLAQYDVAVFRPNHAYSLPIKPVAGVQRVNLAALDACDLLVVVWFKGQQSVGVPLELGQAQFSNKPTLLVHDGWADSSWVLPGWPAIRRSLPIHDYGIQKAIEEASVYSVTHR